MKAKTDQGLLIKNQTRGKLQSLPFARIKDFILGKKYELSVVFLGNAASQALNKKWRGKNKPTNVLSFPLSKKAGEIFINPAKARKEAGSFGRSLPNFIAFLYIHGLVHLKGFDHGEKMEAEEIKARKKFKI